MKTRTQKDHKRPILILAIVLLLSFIGLFVGAGISRNHIKKELDTMKNEENRLHNDFQSRLIQLEYRNKKITRIIGKDEELEKRMETLSLLY